MTDNQKVESTIDETERERLADSLTRAMFPSRLRGYQLDARMNVLFGNPSGNKFKPDWGRLALQFRILEHEFEETRDDGILAQDVNGLLDGIGDMLTVIYGLAHFLGVDADSVHNAVHLSNITKYCRTEEELAYTVKKYEGQGIAVRTGGVFPFAYVQTAKEQEIKGQLVPEGKFLKSVNFKEPDFSYVMRPYPEAWNAAEATSCLDLPQQHYEGLQDALKESKQNSATEYSNLLADVGLDPNDAINHT